MTGLLGGLAVAAAVALVVWMIAGRSRQRRLAALVAAWGRPIERERDVAQLAAGLELGAAGGRGVGLDERTWHDLNLDDVFAVIDRTQSRIGQLALYARLRSPEAPANLLPFDALATWLGSHPVPRQRAQLLLGRLQHQGTTDVWRLTRADVLEVRRAHAIFPVLAILVAGVVVLIPFWPQAIMLLIGCVVANIVVRGIVAPQLWPVLGPFRELNPLLACARKLVPLVPADNPLARPLRDDVPALRRLEKIAIWASRGGAGFAGDPVGLVFEYLNLVFFLDANALYFGSRELARRTGELRRVIDAVGQIDAAIAVASWRAGTPGWTRPVFLEDGAAVTMEGIRNPLIEDCVPNELRVAPRRGWLITGSNMSGKTTFLRTAGVNAVLAQTIYSCPASRYEAPPFVIRSCIGRADNLLEGRSYYLAEVESVLDIAREVRTSRSCLCLFDELFRGTNVIERLAAGEAVLRALVSTADPGGSTVVLTATHDGELVEMLEDVYEAVHFGDRVGTEGLEFDYRLREGPATSRNAIALLRLQGAPPELVERAERTARELDDRSRLVDRRV